MRRLMPKYHTNGTAAPPLMITSTITTMIPADNPDPDPDGDVQDPDAPPRLLKPAGQLIPVEFVEPLGQ
jgi:hypothetical protein